MPKFFAKFKNFLKRLYIRWPRDVEETMASLVGMLEQGEFDEAGREIAHVSLDICSKIESQTMDPRDADVYFTYLLHIMDLSTAPLQKEVKALILEGNVLRYQGTRFGADLNRMRRLANEILGEKDK